MQIFLVCNLSVLFIKCFKQATSCCNARLIFFVEIMQYKSLNYLLCSTCSSFHFYVYQARACFVFERARAPRHFLLGKRHPMRKLLISTGAFQEHQGMIRGRGGNRLRCLHEVSVSTGAFQGHQGMIRGRGGNHLHCLCGPV